MIVFKFITILLLQTFWSTEATPKRGKLIIDQDGGADDAMAIFMALLYEKYFYGPQVVALTTVHGNVNEPQVFKNTQRILDIAKRRNTYGNKDKLGFFALNVEATIILNKQLEPTSNHKVPIYRGSKSALVLDFETDYYFGYDGLGDNATVKFKPIAAKPTQAALALIELSKKYEGDLTIIAIGSLTNIALAMKLDCDFTDRLSQLYVAAGNLYSEEHPKAEFNAQMDVEAYHIVTTNGNPKKITIIPFSQIKDSIDITVDWRLKVLGSIPTEIMEAQNVFEQVSIPTSSSWVLLDPAAMAVVLNPPLIVEKTTFSDNSIHLCGEERGINKNLLTSVHNATTRMIYSVREEPFKQFLYDIFTAELK